MLSDERFCRGTFVLKRLLKNGKKIGTKPQNVQKGARCMSKSYVYKRWTYKKFVCD
jgi:hypothetical protein